MNDFQEIIKSSKPTLVDFFATWCGPCKMQSPILEKVKEKVGDAATIVKIDIDKNAELAARFVLTTRMLILPFSNNRRK